MIRVQKIVYPTDFSSYSNQAYFHALGMADAYGASLSIVYVYSPGGEGEDGSGSDRRYWRNQLEQIRPSNPKIRVQHIFLEGDPASQIVRYADDIRADVIVLGTHGRTGVDRQVLGSVAEKVMREATCSVLVVKLPKGTRSPERPYGELVGAGV